MRKIQLNFLSIFLIYIWTPIIPIHFIPLEDIKWINWIDLQYIFTLQYPSLDYWKIIEKVNQNNSNLSYDLRDIDKNINDDSYDIAILHTDNSVTNVKIAFNAMPLEDISNRNGFPLFKSYSSYPDLLVEHFETREKINSSSTFQVVEKHSDKYLIDENKASGILSRYSSSLGNSYGILTLYAIDKDNDLVLMYKYISDANVFMTYLPLAEKIMDSIKILNN
ncbi:MAG TPA: hypothetical protein VF222_14005 [Nitrososphaeraceae archaeon]